jgi:hypothetical protein
MCRFLLFDDEYEEVKDKARSAVNFALMALRAAEANEKRAYARHKASPTDRSLAESLLQTRRIVADMRRKHHQAETTLSIVSQKQISSEISQANSDAAMLDGGAPLPDIEEETQEDVDSILHDSLQNRFEEVFKQKKSTPRAEST